MSQDRFSYTRDGHSIRRLRERAKSLRAERGCTYNEALDHVARSVGYSGWVAIMNEAPDPDRDEFFSESYRINNRARPEYREFLEERRLEDCADAFRQFLAEDYRRFKSLDFHRYRLDRKPGDADELARHLYELTKRLGREALLPQNMGDEMLERVLGHSRLAFAHMEETRQHLPPTDHLNPLIFCVIYIKHQQKLQKNPRVAAFRMKTREMFEATRNYHLRLELEFLSRRTKVKVQPPTLEGVLLGSEGVSMWIQDE